MLKEYLTSQISKLSDEKKHLESQMNELMQEEISESSKIDKLLESEDVGIELFSPRNPDSKTKVQIDNIRKHIDEIQYKQAEISSKLETNQSMQEKWQRLYEEAENGELPSLESVEKSEEKDSLGHKQSVEEIESYDQVFREILKRINFCIALMGKDRNKCKAELKSLQYYVQALIADNWNN